MIVNGVLDVERVTTFICETEEVVPGTTSGPASINHIYANHISIIYTSTMFPSLEEIYISESRNGSNQKM